MQTNVRWRSWGKRRSKLCINCCIDNWPPPFGPHAPPLPPHSKISQTTTVFRCSFHLLMFYVRGSRDHVSALVLSIWSILLSNDSKISYQRDFISLLRPYCIYTGGWFEHTKVNVRNVIMTYTMWQFTK